MLHRLARPLWLAAALVMLAIAAPAAHAWTPRKADYGVAKETNIPVTMSDGVRLFVDVLRPAKDDGSPVPGRFPVILTQTPYNKNSPQLNFENDYLVERGYVQVIADVRGTGASEGMWDSFGEREQRDGYELAEWAQSHDREWSDGRLGLFGASYGGINQLFTAAQHPDGLKAIFPIIPASDSYRDITGSGGQLNTAFIPSWLGLVTALGLLPPTYTGSDPITAAQVLAAHSNGLLAFQASTLIASTTGSDTAYDGPFYRTRSPIEVIDKVQVPTFIMGGWFDLFQRGEPMLYQRLHENGVPSRLLMGPWYHLTASGGEGLPADGVPAPPDLELRWFDHYLRGDADPTLDKDVKPVTYNELGDGHYKTASTYPFPDVGYKAFALSGPASPGSPGKLVDGATSGTGDPDSIPYNPTAGVCTRSTVQWTAGAGTSTPCETDDSANDTTAISYDFTPPNGIRIGGTIAARLFLSTDAKDGMVAARIEDVSPEGKITQLTAGWQVISLRALDEGKTVRKDGLIVKPYHPFTKVSKLPVEAGKPVEVYVEIFPTAALFAKGHSLRLTLQSGDAPHLTPPLPQFRDSFGGALKVWHDAEHPSQLILPIRDARKTAGSGGESPGGKPRTIKCRDKRRYSFKVHQPRNGRIVRVDAFVNGKLRRTVRGHRVKRVTISKLPRKRFKVRIVAHWNTGERTVSTRVYKGCKKSRPHTHVER